MTRDGRRSNWRITDELFIAILREGQGSEQVAALARWHVITTNPFCRCRAKRGESSPI